jgi:hypothetical protein
MTIPAYAWTKAEVEIIKAAWASDHGKLLINLIVDRIANLHGLSMAVDPYQTAFNEGRRFVGKSIADAVNAPLDKLVRPDDESKPGSVLSATERAARASVERVAAGSSSARKPR